MLNLISDAWIPVRRKDGSRVTIAPWQMADESLAFPDWPRPDLNIACLELLIGLVFLADPPQDAEDWEDRQSPDPDRLRARLSPFAPAFALMGEGPRFMQDRERLEDPQFGLASAPAARLFIDSGGEKTAHDNADLFVKRDRYGALDPALAAMALFTTQIYAYADSSRHKASLRGNGPLVTLVDPLTDGRPAGLWPLVWANVPDGRPADPNAKDLPWLRETVASDGGRTVPWPGRHVPETFFSMPWRIRLIAEGGLITGFVRKDHGTQYRADSDDGSKKKKKGPAWLHPLSPFTRKKPGAHLDPVKAPAGSFFFTNWLGTVVKSPQGRGEDHRAETLRLWQSRSSGMACEVLAAGWAMNKAKPADFLFARVPEIRLDDDREHLLWQMITAAEKVGNVLRDRAVACAPIPGDKKAWDFVGLNEIRDQFFHRVQHRLERRLSELTAAVADLEAIRRGWLEDLEAVAMDIFKEIAEPLLAQARIAPAIVMREGRPQEVRGAGQIVAAWRRLEGTFRGYGADGREVFQHLGLTPPEQASGKDRKRRTRA